MNSEYTHARALHESFIRHFQNKLSVGFGDNHKNQTHVFHLYCDHKIISAIELDVRAWIDGSLQMHEIIEKAGQYMAHQVLNILLSKRGHEPMSLNEYKGIEHAN